MTLVVLRSLLLRIYEHGHEAAGVGDGKLEGTRRGSLVVACRVLYEHFLLVISYISISIFSSTFSLFLLCIPRCHKQKETTYIREPSKNGRNATIQAGGHEERHAGLHVGVRCVGNHRVSRNGDGQRAQHYYAADSEMIRKVGGAH